MARAERGDQLVEIALDEPVELRQREPDAVVGHAVLREVVGADLLRALARRHHAAAGRGLGRVLSFALEIHQAASEDLERLRLVLQLRALVLALDEEAAGLVDDLDGAVGGVDALAARPAARGDADLEVLVVDLDVDLVGLGEDGHRRRRRVDAALRLRGGHALHAVDAPFEAKLRVDVAAGDERDALLEAAGGALALREDLDLPALSLGVARVHAKEVGREERGLFAALRAPELEDGVLSLVRVGREEEQLDRLFEALAIAVELRELRLREIAELGILERVLRLADPPLDVPVARERAHHGLEIAPLLVELRRARAVGQHVRPAEHLFELAVSARELLQLLDREHQAARAGAVSARNLGAASRAS